MRERDLFYLLSKSVMRSKVVMLVCFTAIFMFSSLMAQTFSGAGAGTELSPYQVTSAAQLNEVRNHLNAHFVQMNDIDLYAATREGGVYWNDGKGWEPIGTEASVETHFRGIYDGGGFKITNLFINRSAAIEDRTPSGNSETPKIEGDEDYVGLFGAVVGTSTQTATLKNIKLEGVNVSGWKRVGSLVGKVNDNRYVLIIQCSAVGGTVKGTGTTGGLVGANNGFPTGTPETVRSKMFYCFANIDVSYIGLSSGTDIKIGGLVGCAQRGEIYDSFSLGKVTAYNIVGDNTYYPNRVGGLAGCNEQGLIQRSFSAGEVIPNQTDNNNPAISNIGGFIGRITGQGTGGITDSYWDTQTSGWTTSAGGEVGKTTAEMDDSETYVGWDENIWDFSGSGYPVLEWNPNFDKANLTGTLIYQGEGSISGTGYYANSDISGQGVFAAFQAGENIDTYIIDVHYSTDTTIDAIQSFPAPENLSAYIKYSFESTGILTNGQFVQIQFPIDPFDIWYRYNNQEPWARVPGNTKQKITEFKTVSLPDYTYHINLAGLSLSRQGPVIVEFAGDKGETQTLPVELSSFTATNLSGDGVRLQWIVETETNFLGYNVYRAEMFDLGEAIRANMAIIVGNNSSTQSSYTFIDENVELNTEYFYWLESVDLDLTNEFHGPISIFVYNEKEAGTVIRPEIVDELVGAYPNPFNPATSIAFSLAYPAVVTMRVFNINGQTMQVLVSEQSYAKGRHSVVWDGRDSFGRPAASGIYFAEMITSEGFEMVKKMVLIK